MGRRGRAAIDLSEQEMGSVIGLELVWVYAWDVWAAHSESILVHREVTESTPLFIVQYENV